MSINYSIIDLQKRKASLQLLWIGIVSICMFFAGLTSIIFVDKMKFPNSPSWFLYSTIFIVLSSILLYISIKQIQKDKPIFLMVSSTFLLGLIFTYCQFQGWSELVESKIYFSGGLKEESLLYILTGAHLAHLIVGLIVLLITLVKIKRNRYNSTNYLGLELASTYWHFLTVLWIYLFFFLSYL